MTSAEKRSQLPERAEALLAGWPAPSRSALEWEDLAHRTTEAARGAAVNSTDDALFAAPLPPEPGEDTGIAESPAPVAEEPDLLKIAKQVVAANAGTSAREIALAGLQAAEAERRDAPLAPPPRPPTRAEQEAQSVAGLMGRVQPPPPSRREGPSPVAATSRAHVPHQPVEARAHSEVPGPHPLPSKNARSGTLALGGGIALSIAAALALFVGTKQAPVETAATAQAPVVAGEPIAAKPVAAAPTVAPAPVAPAPGEPKAGGVAQNPEHGADKDSTLSFKVRPSPKSSNTLTLEKGSDPPKAKKSAIPEPTNAELVDAPPQPKVKPVKAAEPEPAVDGLPERPSVGDVQAAAGQVLMRAHMCLAGQEAGSQAQLVFGSDGRVKNVVISGPAAGTPAEACIKGNLSAARVPPFAEKSFSFSLTVRPP